MLNIFQNGQVVSVDLITTLKIKIGYCYCVKSVRIWSYSGPYSVRMWESADQNNAEYGHFLCSVP